MGRDRTLWSPRGAGGADGHCPLPGGQPCGHAGRGAPGLAPPPCGHSRLAAGPGGGPTALTHVHVGEGHRAWALGAMSARRKHRHASPPAAQTCTRWPGVPPPAPPPQLATNISAHARRGGRTPTPGWSWRGSRMPTRHSQWALWLRGSRHTSPPRKEGPRSAAWLVPS